MTSARDHRNRQNCTKNIRAWGIAVLAAGVLSASAAGAQAAGSAPARTQAASDLAQRVNRLALDLERAQAIRAVKRLQRSYAQYSQFGLWDQMADLFSDHAELIYGKDDVHGQQAIRRYFLDNFGGGHPGLLPGGLHAQMSLTPVVTLAPDGRSAKGRWHEFSMLGRYGVSASWAGGIQENDYVKEGGVWKIARLHYYPMFAGSYDTGWHNVDADLKIVPYHYTPAQAGTPVPPLPPNASLPVGSQSPQQVAARLLALDQQTQAMYDEDQVRNLQNAYGYYIDRKMWDDVTDLFTSDGVLEIAGLGLYDGAKNIRRALERDGPAGLRKGELNDQLQIDTIVTIAPGGQEARARGIQLGMLGQGWGKAYWELAVFENRYVKQDGIWRIREMRIFPTMKSDYYQGWAKSAIVDPQPPPAFAPDRPAPDSDALQGDGSILPAFYDPNPVTGTAVSYPQGMRVVGGGSLPQAAPPAQALSLPPADDVSLRLGMDARLDEAERKLAVAKAYDAVENISSAFGDYDDDFQWNQLGDFILSYGAREEPFAGFYIGPDRARQAESRIWGEEKSPRTSIRIHMRIQPVILVAPDGRSAKLRTYLFHLTSSLKAAGDFSSGMYPNDQAVLENGFWKFENVAIDEIYFQSTSYKDGWARWARAPEDAGPRAPEATARRAPRQQRPNTMTRVIDEFPPDIPLSALGVREEGFIPGAAGFVQWPSIKPMWFNYRNPVSGRTPPNYCPDEGTCFYQRDTGADK